MTARFLAKTAMVAAVAFGAFAAAPAFAQQAYGYVQSPQGYEYDACRRAQSNRQTTGGLLGAVAGAVIGGNVASRNARDEGAILGGLLGAAAGAGIGKNSAACTPQPQPYGYAPYAYVEPVAPPPPVVYAPPPPPVVYDRYAEGYGYDQRGRRNDRRDNGRCTFAESPIYLPDGRVERRMVQVCQDARGRYQVVD